VQKSYLFDLIAVVKGVLEPDDLPIIVGSQAIFAQTDDIPSVVRESLECDFLVFRQTAQREKINCDFGVFSEFADEKGYYADALGLASVVLPIGWDERLEPLRDPDGEIVAKCLEIHDLAASKIAAGRPKDIEFLHAGFSSGLFLIDSFLERSLLIRSKLENDALKDRFHRLLDHLKTHNADLTVVHKLREFIQTSL
jgi:hypothetical protein